MMNLTKLSKICLSLKYINDDIVNYAKSITNLIEIRLDNIDLLNIDLQYYSNNFQNIIYKINSQNQLQLLSNHITSQNIIIDIDYNYIKNKGISDLSKFNFIISLHNLKFEELSNNNFKLFQTLSSLQPSFIKLVLDEDIEKWQEKQEKIYSSFNDFADNKKMQLICFFEGEFCKYSRIYSLKLGAPFTYCGINKELLTGNGQYTCDEILQLLRT